MKLKSSITLKSPSSNLLFTTPFSSAFIITTTQWPKSPLLSLRTFIVWAKILKNKLNSSWWKIFKPLNKTVTLQIWLNPTKKQSFRLWKLLSSWSMIVKRIAQWILNPWSVKGKATKSSSALLIPWASSLILSKSCKSPFHPIPHCTI